MSFFMVSPNRTDVVTSNYPEQGTTYFPVTLETFVKVWHDVQNQRIKLGLKPLNTIKWYDHFKKQVN